MSSTPVTYPDPTATRRPDSSLNIAALVLGIVSLVVPFVGLVTAPLAIIFATNAKPLNGMGIAGLITGVIAAAGYVTFLVVPVLASI